MRTTYITFFLLLIVVIGCSQNTLHITNNAHKVPIDAKRWYQLNYTTNGLEKLFDGVLKERVYTGRSKILENFDAWYPVLDGELITIDSIQFFDWEGTNEKHPLTIYAILGNWEKVPIAVFKGTRYNQWVGPNPDKLEKFALEKPVYDIRYLVINSWGEYPTEIEFYGTYSPPNAKHTTPKLHYPLKNYFGVNAFEWDFENPKHNNWLDSIKLSDVKNFTGIRHYMDWDKLEYAEGHYTFNPTHNGSWNYDSIYYWCKKENIEVLACLKSVPEWMQVSYPFELRNNENIPMTYHKNPEDPNSYIEQAKVAFQYAARYGTNKDINPLLLSVDTTPRWNHDVVNIVKVGMGLINYIECDNERDKWWKGRAAYQTGREYAANLSAFYDGNKNTMGIGVGVKNADPNMKVVMAGLAKPSTDYIMGMIDWCKQYRGIKPNGQIDLCWDIINYHYYANDAGINIDKKATTGVAPELSMADTIAENFRIFSAEFAYNMPVWVTETGYDIDQGSPQKAPKNEFKNEDIVQADWTLRTALLYARHGIQKVFFYELSDDHPLNSTIYATSGLVNPDGSKRNAAEYVMQTCKYFGDFIYDSTINCMPIVDRYILNDKKMYVIINPKSDTKSEKSYLLDMGASTAAYIYKPSPNKDFMDVERKITDLGKVQIDASESPVFVTDYEIK